MVCLDGLSLLASQEPSQKLEACYNIQTKPDLAISWAPRRFSEASQRNSLRRTMEKTCLSGQNILRG